MMVDDRDSLTSAPAPEWLSPEEALNRYVPPDSAQAGAIAAVPAKQRFGFRIGGMGLVIDPDKTSEVFEDLTIYPLPTTPRWLRGLVNLRGNLVPIFDLKSLFKIEQDSNERERILVVDKGEKAVGIPIEDFPTALDTSQPSSQLPPLPGAMAEYARTAYVHEGVIWLEFDFDRFFESLGARAVARS